MFRSPLAVHLLLVKDGGILYEKITGRSYEFPEADQQIETRLEGNLDGIT